jgi:hypothetical protein
VIRPVAIEVALFLVPFTIYALFLWATRAKVLDPERWSLRTLIGLTATAFVLMLGSFLILAQFSGAPSGSTYIPAHLEDGRLVPGTTK